MPCVLLVVVAIAVSTATALAQPPAAPASAAAGQAAPRAPGAQPTPPPAPPQPEAFTYNPDGRRDPFTSLIGTGSAADNRAAATRRDGAAGLSVNELSVRGIMQSRGALVAMVQAPDNKTYIVHQGDKLLDGTIKTITAQGLVVLQEVNDPLSLVKQREVSKLLRSLEGGR